MTNDERTFGLSRYEKIRIEAARIAVGTTSYRVNGMEMTDARYVYGHIRKIADPIEAWLLAADADAESRRSTSEARKLADEVVAKARELVTAPMQLHPSWLDRVKVENCTIEGPAGHFIDSRNKWKWLAGHLTTRGVEGAASMSRQDLIRAYYTDVLGGKFPNFDDLTEDDFRLLKQDTSGGARQDDLAVGKGGLMYRWDVKSISPGGERQWGWLLLDELPGHRIENGKILWSPGLWPPPESETEKSA